MNAIIGYSEMLMEEAEDVGQEGFIPDLKKINQAGNHLLSLINSVLDLSKIESGRMEAYAENFEIDNLIDMVSGTAQPLMAKNNNHFEIKRAPHLGSAFQDVTKLRQALLNLISNAAKFTHEGTITLSIKREISNGIEWLINSTTFLKSLVRRIARPPEIMEGPVWVSPSQSVFVRCWGGISPSPVNPGWDQSLQLVSLQCFRVLICQPQLNHNHLNRSTVRINLNW
jgi:hypothetical protein